MSAMWRPVLLASLVLLFDTAAAVGQTTAPARSAAQSSVNALVTVTLPQEEAELDLDGTPIAGSGTSRTVQVSAPVRGGTHRHTLTVTWKPNGYTVMTRSKTVTLRGAEPAAVDLARDDPADRVRVSYVPTPQDVAQEMVALAGIRVSDVVYEPGCGDARITIAAVRAGAGRAICIDIEPARAEESRAKVAEAGLASRIDVRLGDALDVKNLPAVTVVFLYMGDHFNMLIRPVLWKALPVGARVVSHRFLMGDWKPDKSVAIGSSEGGEFEVHLWTITEEVKRRFDRE
jgi:uncharacterized protein (TIGR03000 family)